MTAILGIDAAWTVFCVYAIRQFMTAILGIDAAWTKGSPSGVALLVERHGTWHCAGVAPSYRSFIKLAKGKSVDWNARAEGGEADIGKLIRAAEKLSGGERPCVVAVDMPIATERITGRREADRKASRCFGEFGCPVHSPTKARPGKVGERLMKALKRARYPLATAATGTRAERATIEVYPHPALIALLDADYRLPYKVARSRKYWPCATVVRRRSLLLVQFGRIRSALSTEIDGIALPLPAPGQVVSLAALKPYEDTLDALVCAWVGARYLAGAAMAYGDQTSAIWVPTPPAGWRRRARP